MDEGAIGAQGQDTILVLTGLSADDTSIAIAAYDYLGRQSPYSNVVTVPAQLGHRLFLPAITKGP